MHCCMQRTAATSGLPHSHMPDATNMAAAWWCGRCPNARTTSVWSGLRALLLSGQQMSYPFAQAIHGEQFQSQRLDMQRAYCCCFHAGRAAHALANAYARMHMRETIFANAYARMHARPRGASWLQPGNLCDFLPLASIMKALAAACAHTHSHTRHKRTHTSWPQARSLQLALVHAARVALRLELWQRAVVAHRWIRQRLLLL